MDWKDIEFTGSDSYTRVQMLQALCGPPPKRVDALLFIGGVDSFHSTLSQAALKFLFLGSSGQELLGAQVIAQQHERLEDVVVLLTAHHATVFYSSESDAAVKLLPMLARWRHVREVTVHDAMDPDEQEARKVRAFRSMVAGIKRIGIPYGVDPLAPQHDLQDNMVPEKWPLIQSYGLENADATAFGFFTMNHDVVNVSRDLQRVMAQLDIFSAKRVVREVAPLLEYHYAQFLLKLNHAESPEARTAKSEVDVGDDLLSFYDFGTTQYAARGIEVAPTRGSRVLYGTRTRNVATTSSSSVRLTDAGATPTLSATYMLVQVEDPFSGVRFVRTYFLSTGKICSRIVDDDALVHPPTQQLAQHDEVRSTARDTQLLIELYVLLLRGFRAARRELVAALTDASSSSSSNDSLLTSVVADANAVAVRVMIDYSRTHSHVLETSDLPIAFVDDHVTLHVECLDARGLAAEFRPDGLNLLYVSLTLADVPSQVEPTALLGSLVVGDSLLLRPQQSDPSSSLERDACVCVTSAFPYFRSWVRGGQEADFVRALTATLLSDFMLMSPAIQLGHAVATMDALADAPHAVAVDAMDSDDAQDQGQDRNGDIPAAAQVALARATLLLDCAELPRVDGAMRLFTGGFVFLTPHMNPVLVSLAKHVRSFRVVASPFDELVLLRIDFKPDARTGATSLSESLPFAFASREVYIPLLSGSRFQDELLRVLATWKRTAAALDIPFYRSHDLSLAIDGETPRDSNGDFEPSSASIELSVIVRDACAAFVKRQDSMALSIGGDTAAADAFFPTWFIPKDANPVTTLGRPPQDPHKLCVPVTTMVGIPGSDVVRIAQSVCAISSDANDWVHVSIDTRDAPLTSTATSKSETMGYEQFTFEQICSKLSETLQRVCANVNPRVYPRIMLSVVGYVDSLTVAAAVKHIAQQRCSTSPTSVPGPAVKLSLLAACVSATNVYVPDPLAAQSPFPKLFDQLEAGVATHVVVTRSADVSASALGRLRFHIDLANPFADIHVLAQDVFEGPITALLATDRFESAYYKRFRDAHYPRWYSSSTDGQASMQHVAELDATHRPVSVRFEVAPGMERARFVHLVGAALTPFAALATPLDTSSAKGIRLAQALAANKVRATSSTRGSSVSVTGVMPQADPRAVNQISSGAMASAGAECGVVWNVEARVVFSAEPHSVYHYVSTGSSARMRVESMRAKQLDDADIDSASELPALEVCVTGMDIDAAKVHALLLNCYAHAERSVAPLRTKASVSIDEKRQIQKAHATDPLPDGYLFDGSTYVDFVGGRYEFHPHIAQFIDEYIAAANDATKRTNSKAEESRHAQQAFVKQIR